VEIADYEGMKDSDDISEDLACALATRQEIVELIGKISH
jgi:hypothetical protein